MKIIITEQQEIKLISDLVHNNLNEETVYLGDKQKIVCSWLNKHFKIVNVQGVDNLHLPKISKAIVVLDPYGQSTKQTKTFEDVFYILQTNFKKILSDKKDRDNFLKDTLLKWCNS